MSENELRYVCKPQIDSEQEFLTFEVSFMTAHLVQIRSTEKFFFFLDRKNENLFVKCQDVVKNINNNHNLHII